MQGGESTVNKEIQTEVEKAVSNMFPKNEFASINELPAEVIFLQESK